MGERIDLIELSINSQEQKRVIFRDRDIEFRLSQFDLDFLRKLCFSIRKEYKE